MMNIFSTDIWLIFSSLIGFVLLLVLIIGYKVNAFISILLSTIVIGLLAGIPPVQLAETITNGVGSTLGTIVLLIGIGCMLSALLEYSGGINVIADMLSRKFGAKGAPWAMAFVSAFLVVTVYFDAALILLMPVAMGLARKEKCSSVYYSMPLASGLVAGSGFIPPASHPLLVSTILGASLGHVIFGGVIATVVSVIWGIFFSRCMGKRIYVEPLIPQTTDSKPEKTPGFALVASILLLPLVLILVGTLAQQIPSLPMNDQLQFIGTPFIALLLTLLLAMLCISSVCKLDKKKLEGMMSASVKPVSEILLVIGAGGALRYVLQDSGIGDLISEGVQTLNLPLPVMGFLIGALLRGVIGSTPVAMAMTAGIMAAMPGLDALLPMELAGITVAVCGGASTLCHVNSAGFWLAHALMGSDTKTSLLTWGVNESVVGLIGGIVGCIIYLVA